MKPADGEASLLLAVARVLPVGGGWGREWPRFFFGAGSLLSLSLALPRSPSLALALPRSPSYIMFMLPSSVGKVPDSWFVYRYITLLKSVHFPSCVGIDPVNLLVNSWRLLLLMVILPN